MNRTALGLAALILLSRHAAAGQESASSPIPPDAEIRKILAERVDKYRQSVGMVVGVIEPQGRRIVTYGSMVRGDSRPLTGDTIFEIDSISKVFTSLLLADMAQRGEVALEDPLAKYLPPEVALPEPGGKPITLRGLATHTSGLPRDPPEPPDRNASQWYAFSSTEVYDFLSNQARASRLPSGGSPSYEYSNLGAGLLGHALSLRAGMDYDALVAERIARPLGLTGTHVALTPEMQARLAVGHSYVKEPVPNLDMGLLAGAGGLKSTANDLLTLLSGFLGYSETPLTPAMTSMLSVRIPAGSGHEVALGWHVFTPSRCRGTQCTPLGMQFFGHDGGWYGYRSFVGFDLKARTGVVVLANTGYDDVGDIALHLLDRRFPLQPPKRPTEHKETAIDPQLLDRYSGRYLFPDGDGLPATAVRKDSHLVLRAEEGSPDEFFAETDRDFSPSCKTFRSVFRWIAGARHRICVQRQRRHQASEARRIASFVTS